MNELEPIHSSSYLRFEYLNTLTYRDHSCNSHLFVRSILEKILTSQLYTFFEINPKLYTGTSQSGVRRGYFSAHPDFPGFHTIFQVLLKITNFQDFSRQDE